MISALLEAFDPLPYFTLQSVEQLLTGQSLAPGSLRTALYRWMHTGQVIQLKKGVYMSRRFFELHRGDADFSSAVSAILVPQSYLSLEYILQRYNILTEVTYPVSAITLKNTRVITNPIGTFTYQHIQPRLYCGFSIQDYYRVPFSQASLAKSLFDYLYLRPLPRNFSSAGDNLAEELRLNLEEFSKTDQDDFAAQVANAQSPKMDRILNNLRKHIWRP